MTRYDLPGDGGSLFEAGSNRTVLKNRLGITRIETIERLEFESFLHIQEAYGEKIATDTIFTSETIRQMHRDWLGEIYDWAGEYRQVNLSKGSFQWPPAHLVEKNMERFEGEILSKFTPCKRADKRLVANAIARVHGDLLLCHPFLDGNGRLARWLAQLMAQQAGMYLKDFGVQHSLEETRRAYIQSVTKAYGEDFDDLTVFFSDSLDDSFQSSSG